MNKVGTKHNYDLKRSGKSTIKCKVVVHSTDTNKSGMRKDAILVKIVESEAFIVNNLN